VAPTGGIVAAAGRPGTFLGNRGPLTRRGRLVRDWAVRRWITCALTYKDWRAPAFGTDGRYTPLFFLDEAVALAAGHRPCWTCRNADHRRFRQAWAAAHGPAADVDALDRRLHGDRLDGRVQRRHARPWGELPDACFVLLDGVGPARVAGDRLLPWAVGGYEAARPRPAGGDALVLTPSCTVDVLLAGYEVAPVTP
jgi:hypothetical protein